ncbi:hypothetical protein FOYG_17434 [Fusarium oxysporum NRRL 32931]|uniref:Uncharacterized protein n=1 Tax=Fusarium oxysporum NRRL 32931 TaxID=660029 RepID=W9HEI9_FUSOX|nr:hypothetical protein FOYG_17434 [Fusarium oxysporum NRRL 32931]
MSSKSLLCGMELCRCSAFWWRSHVHIKRCARRADSLDLT